MPNYKRVFIDGYCYFLTVVTHKRNPILIDNIDLLRKSFKQSKKKYNYDIKAIVILPDHFHMIILPARAIEYPKIISVIKQCFSSQCDPRFYQHLTQSKSRIQAGYKPIWQKKYYEHTIRNDDNYKTRFDYIHYNPVKHEYVKQVKVWLASSFHRSVKQGIYHSEWGDFNEKVDYE
jgi:putative transposase